MLFLAVNEIWDWCANRGVTLVAGDSRPAPDPDFQFRKRVVFASGTRSGKEPQFAKGAIIALNEWDECLLWITKWGVWPSGEDWPRYYASRGLHSMKLSIEDVPGHLFEQDDGTELSNFLTMTLEFAWDAYLLPAKVGKATGVRIQISHDEWFEVQSVAPLPD